VDSRSTVYLYKYISAFVPRIAKPVCLPFPPPLHGPADERTSPSHFLTNRDELEAIGETLPYKDAYRTAKLEAPAVFRAELDPKRYIRRYGGNIKLAAQSLVAYWRTRVELFGQQRAFLPMSLVTTDEIGNTSSALSVIETTMIAARNISIWRRSHGCCLFGSG